MRIEILYPEVANLYGDLMNMDYLCRCLGGAEIIRTSLHSEPAFVNEKVDLIYMGSVTEEGQRLAVEALTPYRDKLVDLIEEGQHADLGEVITLEGVVSRKKQLAPQIMMALQQ